MYIHICHTPTWSFWLPSVLALRSSTAAVVEQEDVFVLLQQPWAGDSEKLEDGGPSKALGGRYKTGLELISKEGLTWD